MLIIETAKAYLSAIIGVAAAAAGFYAASLYYGHRLDVAREQFDNYRVETEAKISAQKISVLEQSAKLQQEADKLAEKLTEMTNENFKNYSDLQTKNKLVRDGIASGVAGLRVNAICPQPSGGAVGAPKDSGAGRVDDGATVVAVIDPADGAAIVEITNEADRYRSQLAALQSWVRELIKETNK